MGCHTLLQGTFATQGLNPGLPHCRQILYHLSHQGSPSLPHFIQMIKDRNCAFSTTPVLLLSPSLTETALLNDIKAPQLLSATCFPVLILMDFFLWCIWYFPSWPPLRIPILLASVILHCFSVAIGPLDIGVSLKFWSHMGCEWIPFYIHPDWFHPSQGVCDSSSRLRAPWCHAVCFIHCSVPQRVPSPWCRSCFLDRATLGHAHLLVSTSVTFKGLSCFLLHLYHCKGAFFCWGDAGLWMCHSRKS